MGQEQNVKNKIELGYRFDVLSASDEAFEVRMTYYRVRFEQEGPMGAISYDSENPPETVPMQARGFSALVGQSMTMKLDPMGKVLEVKGVDDMLERMLAQYGEIDETMRGQIEQSLRGQFGEEAMTSQMESMFAIYPEEDVAVGDTWSREVSVRSGLPLKVTTNYRLAGLEGNRAALEMEGKILPDADGPVNMGGMQIEFDITGTQKGTAVMDVSTGLIVEATSEQEVSGDMVVNDGAMTWPLVLTTKTMVTMEK